MSREGGVVKALPCVRFEAHGPGRLWSVRVRSQGKLENHLKVKISGLGARLATGYEEGSNGHSMPQGVYLCV